jgi:hypothetical protein
MSFAVSMSVLSKSPVTPVCVYSARRFSRHFCGVAKMAVDSVMLSLSDAVTPGEFDDVISQLPDDFKHLRRRAWAEA